MKQEEHLTRNDDNNAPPREYREQPDEFSPLPEEYAQGSDFNRSGAEYSLPTHVPAEEGRKPNKKLFQQILAAASVVAVVTVTAVSTGQLQLPGTAPSSPVTQPPTEAVTTDIAPPSEDLPVNLHWKGDTLIYTYPSYRYLIEAGNRYRLSFDESQIEAYYDYLAGYIYALCQCMTDELAAQTLTQENQQDWVPLDAGIMTGDGFSGGAYHDGNSMALFGVYYSLCQSSIRGTLRIQHNNDYFSSHTADSGNGYIEMIGLDEDAACFDLPIAPRNQIFGYGILIRETYAWGKDLTYDEIRAHLTSTSTLDEPRSVSQTNPRVKEILVTEGSADIYVPSFIKVERFPAGADTAAP